MTIFGPWTHAITGNSNDINLLKFAWKKTWNRNKWIICGGFFYSRRLAQLSWDLIPSWENSKFALSPISQPQSSDDEKSKQAKIIWFKKLRIKIFEAIGQNWNFRQFLESVATFCHRFVICRSTGMYINQEEFKDV